MREYNKMIMSMLSQQSKVPYVQCVLTQDLVAPLVLSMYTSK